jgi:prepilin-type N-terminal cleavage/methylation domain-containing protein
LNKSYRRHAEGFTLVELLIVVLILGILATVAVPQFGSSTEDAKLSTLESNLSIMRNAIERYYHEHGTVYPGAKKAIDGSDVGTADRCASAFRAQLTRYSQSNGVTAKGKSATAKYGPYVKKVKLPKNPFTDTRTVLCDIVENDITVAASSGPKAWKFYLETGRFIANDGAHDSY